MLTLKQPDDCEIEICLTAKIVCNSCTNEAYVPAKTPEQAVQGFKSLGWRAYETDYELGTSACPCCVNELKQINQDIKL